MIKSPSKTAFLLFVSLNLSQSAFCASTSIIDTAQEAKKAIVGIHSLRAAADRTLDPASGKNAKPLPTEQSGAGVVIDPKGYIITNYHVVYLAEKIGVILQDDSTVSGEIVHVMPEDDLALLKIDAPIPLKAIDFGNSDYVEIGDEVINIGHSPFLKQTISGGRISGIGRGQPPQENAPAPIELFGVNMDLYKGDSGGPLLNHAGQLIGMIAADVKDAKATIVIPSNKIKKLYQDFIK